METYIDRRKDRRTLPPEVMEKLTRDTEISFCFNKGYGLTTEQKAVLRANCVNIDMGMGGGPFTILPLDDYGGLCYGPGRRRKSHLLEEFGQISMNGHVLYRKAGFHPLYVAISKPI